MRKLGLIILVAVICLSFGIMVNANEEKKEAKSGEFTFGGHMRLWFYDNVSGDSTVGTVKKSNTQVAGAEFSSHSFIFFISKNITENLSVSAAPDFALGSAGATPSLGKFIGQQRAAYSPNDPTLKFNNIYVKYNMPEYKLELRGGYIGVEHTWDYAQDLFWQEQLNGTKFICDSNLGAWHDTGIEAYRSFEVSNISVPVWLYILNGSGGAYALDNNTNKAIYVHAEPEFGGQLDGLKASIGYGFGKWGNEDYVAGVAVGDAHLRKQGYYRWSLGASYDYQQFSARFEAAGANFKNKLGYGTANKEDQGYSGYYLKLFYRAIPDKLTVMLNYDVANKETTLANNDEFLTTMLALQYELGPEAMLIFEYDMMDWKNDGVGAAKNEISANRISLGMRITF